jgi:hypothetical protein
MTDPASRSAVMTLVTSLRSVFAVLSSRPLERKELFSSSYERLKQMPRFKEFRLEGLSQTDCHAMIVAQVAPALPAEHDASDLSKPKPQAKAISSAGTLPALGWCSCVASCLFPLLVRVVSDLIFSQSDSRAQASVHSGAGSSGSSGALFNPLRVLGAAGELQQAEALFVDISGVIRHRDEVEVVAEEEHKTPAPSAPASPVLAATAPATSAAAPSTVSVPARPAPSASPLNTASALSVPDIDLVEDGSPGSARRLSLPPASVSSAASAAVAAAASVASASDVKSAPITRGRSRLSAPSAAAAGGGKLVRSRSPLPPAPSASASLNPALHNTSTTHMARLLVNSIDNLPPAQKLVVKVACVLGDREFPLKALEHLYLYAKTADASTTTASATPSALTSPRGAGAGGGGAASLVSSPATSPQPAGHHSSFSFSRSSAESLASSSPSPTPISPAASTRSSVHTKSPPSPSPPYSPASDTRSRSLTSPLPAPSALVIPSPSATGTTAAAGVGATSVISPGIATLQRRLSSATLYSSDAAAAAAVAAVNASASAAADSSSAALKEAQRKAQVQQSLKEVLLGLECQQMLVLKGQSVSFCDAHLQVSTSSQ